MKNNKKLWLGFYILVIVVGIVMSFVLFNIPELLVNFIGK